MNHSTGSGSTGNPYTCGRCIPYRDFKVDYTPVDDQAIDLARIAEPGTGACADMADSTNVEPEGYTLSERSVEPI